MKKIEKHIDAQHHPAVQKLAKSIDDIEKAVLSQNIDEIVRVYEELLPASKKLLPEFKNPRLRQTFADTIKYVEELLVKLKSEDKNFGHVNEFLRKILGQSTTLLSEILVEVA